MPRISIALLLFPMLTACGDNVGHPDHAADARSAAASPAPDPADSLWRLERRWADAIRGRDSLALEAILAPDFVLTGSGAEEPPISRAVWMRNTLHQLHVDSVRLAPGRVAARGDSADATLGFFWAGRFGGEPAFRDSVDLSDAWVRDTSGWRVHRRTVLAPKQE
jgi:uncharacterized protein DUF4440